MATESHLCPSTGLPITTSTPYRIYRTSGARPSRPPPLVFTFSPVRVETQMEFSTVITPSPSIDDEDTISLSRVFVVDDIFSSKPFPRDVPASANCASFVETIPSPDDDDYASASPLTLLWDDDDDDTTNGDSSQTCSIYTESVQAAQIHQGYRASSAPARRLTSVQISNPWDVFATMCLEGPEDETLHLDGEAVGVGDEIQVPPSPPIRTPRPNAEEVRVRRAQLARELELVNWDAYIHPIEPDPQRCSVIPPTNLSNFRSAGDCESWAFITPPSSPCTPASPLPTNVLQRFPLLRRLTRRKNSGGINFSVLDIKVAQS